MQRWLQTLRHFYSAPFQIDPALVEQVDFATFEARRQHLLARLVMLHLVAFQTLGLILAVANASAPTILLAQSAGTAFSLLCVVLLYTRWVDVGIFLYVYGVFALVVGVSRVNPGGVTILSVLVAMLLVLFILLSGLLLPRIFIGLSTLFSIGATAISVAFSSVDASLRVGTSDPRVLITGFLGVIFLSAGLLSYLLARSAAAGTASALRAYQQQQELAALKDQFIIYINHELRTPLVGFYGNVELVAQLNNTLDAAQRQRMLNRALQAGDTLLALLENALDPDTLRPDAVRIQLSSFALAPLVRELIESFDPRLLGEPGLEQVVLVARDITLALPPDLRVQADPLRVRQILTNLLTNALKYSPASSPLFMSASPTENAMVEIRVRDWGYGVPPAEAPKLFQRFVRLDRDIASTTRGTGVGLYLCRILVAAMGGQIWLESSGIPGEGSTFIFTLPRATTPTQV